MKETGTFESMLRKLKRGTKIRIDTVGNSYSGTILRIGTDFLEIDDQDNGLEVVIKISTIEAFDRDRTV